MLAGSDSDTAYEGEEEEAYDDKDRTSAELRRDDLELLKEEEEREKLIASSTSTPLGGFRRLFQSDRERRKSRRDGAGRRPRSGEDSRLMEEGGRLSSSSSRESSEVGKHRVRDVRERRKVRRHIRDQKANSTDMCLLDNIVLALGTARDLRRHRCSFPRPFTLCISHLRFPSDEAL